MPNIRHHSGLTDFQKLLFGEINQLAENYGICENSDGYFAELYQKPESIVKKGIRKLKELNFLFEFKDSETGNRLLCSCSHGLAKEMYEESISRSSIDTQEIIFDNPIEVKEAFVYLMKDHRTGYHKIGFSKTPKYRESTLQSEMPVIEMLFNFPGTRKVEKEIHEIFSNKRIRGEWFNLSGSDIDFIKTNYNPL